MLEGLLNDTNRDPKGDPALGSNEAVSLRFPAFTLPAVLPTSASSVSALLEAQHAQLTDAAHVALQEAVSRVERQAQTQVDARVLQLVEQHIQEQVNKLVQQQVDNQVQDLVRLQVQQQVLEHIERLLEQIRLQRHRFFGVSSEQLSAQSRLFDEAEVVVAAAPQTGDAADLAVIPAPAIDVTTPEAAPASTKPPGKKARGKRGPLAAHLERVDVLVELPEAERLCACGTPMIEIGQEVSEQLDIVPMRVRVLRTIRKRYACPDTAGIHSDTYTAQAPMMGPKIAPMPAQPLPKTNASADFLAMLITTKYVDGLPLTRFERVLERHGAPVPRQTLARWVIGTAKLLQPLHNLARDRLLEGPVIHMDETPVQVLCGTGKKPTSENYMWVQTGGPPKHPVVLFDYDPSRGGDVPIRLLEGWTGYLMTDGFSGYSPLSKIDGIERLGCWAHARRGLFEAIKAQPQGKRGLADTAVEMIGKLYLVEREFKEASNEVRLKARQERSDAILKTLKTWIDLNQPHVPPKSTLGKAMGYLTNQWARLIRYTERGDLPIDNNKCENAIRPFVVGRKAWLFSDTMAGAHASAVLYSLVETAKANGHEPYTWLRHVLRDLPKASTVDEVDALMPWNLDPTQTLMELRA
jgi:transposase